MKISDVPIRNPTDDISDWISYCNVDVVSMAAAKCPRRTNPPHAARHPFSQRMLRSVLEHSLPEYRGTLPRYASGISQYGVT